MPRKVTVVFVKESAATWSEEELAQMRVDIEKRVEAVLPEGFDPFELHIALEPKPS